MLGVAARYFHTTRHLRTGQILGRLGAQLKRKVGLPQLPEPPATLQGALKSTVPFVHHDPWNNERDLKEGRFCFLNSTAHLGSPTDWKASGQALLWQFNLHYFGYLYLLSREVQLELSSEWIRANPVGMGAGWHPYPTSLRIVNWCKLQLDSPDILKSIYQQASYLYRNVEFYQPGNHLLENATALIFAGVYFNGQGEAKRWLEKGLEIYRTETPVQVLRDGGYFECSPMYHALMLEGYLDVINILPPQLPDVPLLTESAKRMSDFLLSVTHPDGNIALFSDSTHEIAPSTLKLMQYSRDLLQYTANRKCAFDETGYFVHHNNDIYLIIDGGPIGPDFLPAHAHADIFSYELSVHGRPFIVDSGVFEYSAGDMRSYVRSTRAHNTVSIDGIDQAECWSSFRVARRFAPHVSYSRDGTQTKFEGAFSGYARLIGDRIVHRRLINCDDELREIRIEDTIEGRGTHLVESLIHLHPDVSVESHGSKTILGGRDARCVIEMNGQSLSSRDGWFCPEFGLKKKNKVLVVGGKHSLPVQVAYTIRY